MSTEISAPYPGRWGNKHWKSRRIYVALGHDEIIVERSPNSSHVYDHGFMDNTNRQAVCKSQRNPLSDSQTAEENIHINNHKKNTTINQKDLLQYKMHL